MVINLWDGLAYIGKTEQTAFARWYAHLKDKGPGRFARALRKYGREGFIWIILDLVPWYEANKAEIFWIAEYATQDPNGYNLTKGGNGSGTYKKGVEKYSYKLHHEWINVIRCSLIDAVPPRHLESYFGVARNTISDVKTGYTWSEVSMFDDEVYNIEALRNSKSNLKMSQEEAYKRIDFTMSIFKVKKRPANSRASLQS